MPIKMTQDEFLAKRGLQFVVSDFTLDKTVFPHGETRRQRLRREKVAAKYADEYQNARSEAIREYKQLCESGEIIQPTSIELMIRKANGHPDNESTQAARRILNKRGIDWEKGELK